MKLCKDCAHYKKRKGNTGLCLNNKADIWGPDSETGEIYYPRAYDMRRSDKWCGDAKWWEKRYSWWQIFKK
jgi:hypothetical protein